MGVIPNSKIGDCTCCSSTNVQCRKRGKDLICLNCCKKMDNKKQIEKSNLRNQVRQLGNIQKQEQHIPQGTAELQRWFEDRHREMKGVCKHCGGKTEKGKGTYKCSVAHILPKAYFKSIATHPLNWIELCFYGQSCHTNFDNMSLDIMDLNCFDEVITKFVSMYPSIAPQERRRIPQVLLQYIETET